MARYVGCYLEIPSPWQQANPADRLVPYRLFDAPDPDLTIEKCANLARAGGFQYFSLSWGNQCWAGYGDWRAATARGQSFSCSFTCSGNILQICGGVATNSLYELLL